MLSQKRYSMIQVNLYLEPQSIADNDGLTISTAAKNMETGPTKKTWLYLDILCQKVKNGLELLMFWRELELSIWLKIDITL